MMTEVTGVHLILLPSRENIAEILCAFDDLV